MARTQDSSNATEIEIQGCVLRVGLPSDVSMYSLVGLNQIVKGTTRLNTLVIHYLLALSLRGTKCQSNLLFSSF